MLQRFDSLIRRDLGLDRGDDGRVVQDLPDRPGMHRDDAEDRDGQNKDQGRDSSLHRAHLYGDCGRRTT